MSSKASLVTRDLPELVDGTGNIYQSVVIISKRARQISTKIKEELSGKLAEFATSVDTLDEIHENREQIEISKFYERMAKPSMLATQEFLEGKVFFVKTENKEREDEEAAL
jgi:DNA-directed RNA polymerase subunit K/omega